MQVWFTDGHRLLGLDGTYEAWSLAGPGVRKVVCLPGDELVVSHAEVR